MAEEQESLGFDLGAELTPPKISTSNPLDVPIPEPSYNKQVKQLEQLDVNLKNEEYQNLLDDVETGNLPNPQVDITDPLSIDAARKQIQNSFTYGPENAKDPFGLAQTLDGDFRDPKKQNTFYKRYKEHGAYEDLGFSPYRDNEEYYNERTSTFGDFGRASGQWWELAKLGFGDMIGISDMDNLAGARKYAEASAIGSSTKDGLGAFGVNTFLNSGYTLGIIGEMVVEEAALLGVEALAAMAVPVTFGASASVNVAAGARMAYTAQKGTRRIAKAWKQAAKMRKTMDAMQDANKARSFFGKSMQFLNPFENTTAFIKGVGDMGDINKLTKTVRGAGGFIRDMRGIRGTYNEAILEANMVQDDMHSAMLDDFRAKHGRAPNEAEAQEMLSSIKKAGASTAIWNSALIGVTNKFTLGPLLRPMNRGIGMGMFDLGKTGRKFVQQSYKKGVPEAYKLLSRNMFKRGYELVRNPRALIGKSLLYSSDNFAEGIQEVGQEAISGWQKDYHTAQFQGNEVRGGYYSYLADNLVEQVSPQGFETFMSGFLMQKFVAPVTSAGSALARPDNYSSAKDFFKDRKKWREDRAENDVKAQEIVDNLNKFYQNPENYLSKDLMSAVRQGEYATMMADAEKDGDVKSYYDVKDSQMFDNILLAIQTGRLDSMVGQLEGLKDLTNEETQQEYGMDQSTFHDMIDKSVKRAKHIENSYNGLQKKFNNPVNYKQYKYGSPERAEAFKNHQAWEAALGDIAFNSYTFTRSLERAESILGKVSESTGFENTPLSEITSLFSVGEVQKELQLLSAEISSIEQSGKLTPELGKQVKEKKDKQKKLTTLVASLKALEDVTENENAEDVYEVAKKAYEDYMTFIAKKNGDHAHKDKIEESFKELVDYYKLKGRSESMVERVNQMLDPENFINIQRRLKDTYDQAMAMRYDEIKKSYKEYMKGSTLDNKLLNALADIGVFLDVEELKKLKEEGIFPDALYYTDPGQGGEYEVAKTSPLYKKAVDVIGTYYDIKGNISLSEFKENYNIYKLASRKKKEGDNRTYDDIAAQYGFDPKAETAKVPLTKVLQSIIDSEFSDTREKELAKILLAKATPEEYVTFSKSAGLPSKYTVAEQNTVNAKFSSDNYKEGKINSPIEYFILNGEIQRRLNIALAEDKEFRAELEGLMKEAQAEWNKLSPEEKANYGGEMFALENIESFAIDAMTNLRVQAFLTTVKTNQTFENSLWKKFVDAVINNMSKILNIAAVNGTVLNAALDVITTKIDPSGTAKAKEAAETTGTTEKVTRDISINDLKINHPELLNDLIESFIEYNDKQVALGEDSIIPEGTNKADIAGLEVFKNYISNREFTSPEEVFEKYNEELGAQTETSTNATFTPTTPYGTETGPEMTTSTESTNQGLTTEAKISMIEEEVEFTPEQKMVNERTKRKDKYKDNIDEYYKWLKNRYYTKGVGAKTFERIEALEDVNNPKKSVAERIAAKMNIMYDAPYNGAQVSDVQAGINEGRIVPQTDDTFAGKVFKAAQELGLENNLKDKATDTPKSKPSTEVTFVAPKSGIVTRAVKTKLNELGYNEIEIQGMGNAQAYAIANEGLTKEQRAQNDAQIDIEDSALEEERQAAREEIESIINKPKNYNEYENMVKQINDVIADATNPLFSLSQLNIDELEKLIDIKLKSLAEDVNFDDLVIGEVVMVERKNKAGKKYLVSVKVSAKDSDSITLEYLNPDKKGKINSFKVMKDKINTQIKYKYSEALENSDLDNADDAVSEEEVENAKETIDKLEDLEDSDTVNQDREDSKNKTQEEIDAAFIDEINNNCE